MCDVCENTCECPSCKAIREIEEDLKKKPKQGAKQEQEYDEIPF